MNRLQTWLALPIFGLALCAAHARADVIQADSVAGKNVTAAADFIRASGRTDVADNIMDFMKRGKLYSDNITESGTTAKTSSLSNITIDKQQVAPLTKALDPEKQLKLVAGLAAILFHEKIHAHQSWSKFLTDSGEYEAWTQTIYEMDRWIHFARAKYDRTHDKNDLEKMADLVDLKKTEVEGFIEGKCFGGNCELWKDLLKTVKDLQDAVAKEGKRIAQKAAAPARVGMLVDETDKKEKAALGFAVLVPPVKETKADWPGFRLVPPSCFASMRERAALEGAIGGRLSETEGAIASAGTGLAHEKAQSEADGLVEIGELAKATPLCPSKGTRKRRKSSHRDESDPLYMEGYRSPAQSVHAPKRQDQSESPPPGTQEENQAPSDHHGPDAPGPGSMPGMPPP
jgi:hypothetical protein